MKSRQNIFFTILTIVVMGFTTYAADTLWSHKPTQDIKWYQLTDAGTLLVGTGTSIYSLDPETGNELWARPELAKISEEEIHQIEGTPLLLIGDPQGFMNGKTALYCLDVLTGKNLWETDKIKGHAVEITVNPKLGIAIVITVVSNKATKDKLDIYALEYGTGKVLWQTEYSDKVDLYGKEKGSKYFPTFDLSGANPPIIDEDAVYMTYAGIHKYSLKDGSLLWKSAYDVTEGAIKRGNGQARIDGDVIYTSAKGQLRAFDKNSGSLKWTSKDFGGAVAEMIVDGKTIYGRLGGNFYDFNKRQYVKKGPLGVVALDKNSGTAIWNYEGAKNSITNMAISRETNSLLIGDEKNLIGLDLNSQGKVKEAYKIKLEFKNKIGAAAAGVKVAKIGFGMLSGGAVGALKGATSGGADTTDDPVQISPQENGQFVIRGMQHILSFDPRSKAIGWSTHFEAPTAPTWQKIAMGALTAFAVMGNLNGSVNSQISSGYKSSTADRYEDSMINAFSSYEKFLTKRYSATKTIGNFTYVMTNLMDGKEKAAGIIGVNMMTGQGERQIMFADKDPDYEIDEASGRVFNLKNSKDLTAFMLK